MMSHQLSFNIDLVNDVARRKTVLFVGAGASKWAAPSGGNRFKDWTEFLEHACIKVQDTKAKKLIKGRIKKGDFLIASELLKINLGDEWGRILSAEFQQAAEVSRLHKALIALDQRVIVTTNFDKLIEMAWQGSHAKRYPTVISRLDHKAFKLFRDDESYLIKLHGSIDDPESIVFDKSSYQETAFANQFYRDLLSTLLLTHTFVFIGFSMDDPAIALVLESHAYRYSDTRPHYIFTPGSPVPQIDELSKKLRKLFVIRYPEKDNHVALAEGLESLAEQARTQRRLLSSPEE